MDTTNMVYDTMGKAIGTKMIPEDKRQLENAVLLLAQVYDTVSDMTGIFPYYDDEPYCQTEPELEHDMSTMCDHCAPLALKEEQDLQSFAHWLYYDVFDGYMASLEGKEEMKNRGIDWLQMYREIASERARQGLALAKERIKEAGNE